MNTKKLNSALRGDLDATRLLAQFLYDADPPLLDYEQAMDIPVRHADIGKAIATGWDGPRSDEIGQALAEIEEQHPRFVERVWAALEE